MASTQLPSPQLGGPSDEFPLTAECRAVTYYRLGPKHRAGHPFLTTESRQQYPGYSGYKDIECDS